MFLLPLLFIALVGFAAYVVMQHRAQPATGMGDVATAHGEPHTRFWPTTVEGHAGLVVFALNFLRAALLNVVQVPYVAAVVLIASAVLTGAARFARHDRSTSVLIAFVISAVATVAGLLFLAGEIFIGHD